MIKKYAISMMFLVTSFYSVIPMGQDGQQQPGSQETVTISTENRGQKRLHQDDGSQSPFVSNHADDYSVLELDVFELDHRALQAIRAMNPSELGMVFAVPAAAHFTSEQKKKLCDEATLSYENVAKLIQAANIVSADVADWKEKNRFSFEDLDQRARMVVRAAQAFQLFKNFKFPQTVMSPRPYVNDARPTLDKLLEVLIVNEKQAISVCAFHLTLYNVAESLVQKKSEGIDISVVTNQRQGDNVPLQALKYIAKNDISVVCPMNNGYETNHHKFWIFHNNVTGKSLVWAGSYNATGHSNKNSWEDATVYDDPEVVEEFLQRFAEIKAASKAMTADDFDKILSNPTKYSLENNNVPKKLWPVQMQ